MERFPRRVFLDPLDSVARRFSELGDLLTFDSREGRTRGGSAADATHGSGGLDEILLADAMSGFLAQNDLLEGENDLVVGSAAAEQGLQIVFLNTEQTGAHLAIGGEAEAIAVSAEGLADGSDDADFTASVGESVSAGGLAGI